MRYPEKSFYRLTKVVPDMTDTVSEIPRVLSKLTVYMVVINPFC